ncbi:MAG: hypothetical protein OSA23_08340 [Rhodospirillales bacterium]|nr:hypothetical protein [Rhodospirillales bacterium]
MSSSIIRVTQAANETGGPLQQVLMASSELSQQSTILQTEVDRFI